MTTFEQAEVDEANARGGEERPARRPTGKRPVWMEKPRTVVQAAKFVFLSLAILLVVIPFWSVVATSLADQKTINESGGGMVMWPKGVSLQAYRSIIANGVVTRALVISITITVVGTLLSLAATAGLAYWLARRGSVGSKPVLMLVLGAILFAPGLIPSYLLVKELHLLNSWWSLILPVMVNAFNVIVMRAFFQELPEELFESAEIDGASSIVILTRIVLPLSKAVMAVIGLFYAVAYWNAFFNALLYINSSDKWPMALVLRTYVVNQTAIGVDQAQSGAEALPPQLSLQMAILVAAIVPILIVYPFLQKHFAKGVLIGAVKG